MSGVLALLYATTLVTTLSGMEVVSGIAVFYWIYSAIRARKVDLPLWRPILFFSIVVIIGIVSGEAMASDKLSDLFRLRFFIFFWASAYLLRVAPIRRWRWLWLGLYLAVCSYSTLQHFTPTDWFRPEGKKVILFADGIGNLPLVLGLFNHHLTFSNIFMLYAPMFLSYGFFAFPRHILCWGLAAWTYVLTLWTGSRAAWVAFPITVFSVSIGKSWRWLGPLVTLVATSLVLWAFYSTHPEIRERIQRTFETSDHHQTFIPRARLWRVQWEFIKSDPILGVGWNNNERQASMVFQRLYPNEPHFSGHAHSMPLQILATTGVLGFLSFLAIWFGVFQRLSVQLRPAGANREERWVGLGLAAAFIGFWIQGLTQWNFGDAEVLHNVMFLWGAAFSIPIPERK